MPSYIVSAINHSGKRVLNRKTEKRAFALDRMRHMINQHKLMPRDVTSAACRELLRTGEPLEVKGWTLMIETFEEKEAGDE